MFPSVLPRCCKNCPPSASAPGAQAARLESPCPNPAAPGSHHTRNGPALLQSTRSRRGANAANSRKGWAGCQAKASGICKPNPKDWVTLAHYSLLASTFLLSKPKGQNSRFPSPFVHAMRFRPTLPARKEREWAGQAWYRQALHPISSFYIQIGVTLTHGIFPVD